jgi:peptide/nickel transport system substrate-binding protein
MANKIKRFRPRRSLRARKKLIIDTADSANKQLDRHIFRRFHNWGNARRFVVGWIALLTIITIGLFLQTRALNNDYQQTTFTKGGVYSEGLVGNVKNVNPIFLTENTVDNSLSRLIFSGLLTYDENNNLVTDLAESYTSDEAAKKYIVQLRKDARWHDGVRLSADDVLFTYKTIQNTQTQSPLNSTWRGIKIEKTNDSEITFTLPNSYSPFPHLLTTGIIPRHILKSVEPEQLRSSRFNTVSPIGSGPFKFLDLEIRKVSGVQSEIIQLIRNDNYYNSKVELEGITIYTYPDKKDVLDALQKKEINGAPLETSEDENFETIRYTQTSALYLFLNTSKEIVNDLKFREAVISAVQPGKVSAMLNYPVKVVRSPILKGQLGYNQDLNQKGYDLNAANVKLNEIGWTLKEGDQYRKKDGKELTLEFVSENTPEFLLMSEEIQKQLAQVGIKTNVTLEDPANLQQDTFSSKEYDLLLYSINIGPDPDVYVYWHSSQAEPGAKPGYNLSLYKSKKADNSLEAGRSRSDSAIRASKYQPFLEAWNNDVPAIGFHQPVVSYSRNIPVNNMNEKTINIPADRYNNAYSWQINVIKQTRQ